MAESAFKRAHRVGQLLQKELGDLLVNELKDPRIGFVTVTEVRPSDDLRTARIFVSVYGTDEVRQETLTGLQEAAGYIKRQLAHRVNLRFTPNLTFVLDTTLDKAERIDMLIAGAKQGTADQVEAAGSEEPVIVPVQTPRSELAERAEALKPKTEKKRNRRSGALKGRPRRGGRQRKRK